MTKLIKEAKRFQELAGINEVKIKSNTPLNNILEEYIKGTEDQLNNYNEDEQDEIQQFLSTIDKNVASVEDLAEKIKQIDDFMTNEWSGASEGEFYLEDVIEPLIKRIFPKIKPSETKIKELLDNLDELYFENWDEDEYTIGDSYQIYLNSK
jgi:hypothetical protein